ncbi:HAD family hydrolase [Aliikangiella sp. IMCC44359]|uniref:HAD family hydrolase n=1 Tax=Aliikangiella sp. IMCC44359 TaxID=3459125 RepID=UPI00403A9F8B
MSSFSNKFKVISFDLDNALYDNRPVIIAAENACKKFLKKKFLQQNEKFDYQLFGQIRTQIIASQNPAFEDLSLLRKTVLTRFCEKLNNADEIVDEAFNVFIEQRTQVYIEPQIFQLLKLLSEHYILVSISNGNCNIKKSSIGQFFKANYSPTQGFRAKPHPQMLLKTIQDFCIVGNQLLHIGDSIEKDGGAAKNAQANFFHFKPFEKGYFVKAYCKQLLHWLQNH